MSGPGWSVPDGSEGNRACGLALLVGLVALGGCHHYSAVERGTLAPGDAVTLTLSAGASDPASPEAARPAGEVTGRVVSVGGDTVAVRTARPARRTFRSGQTAVDTVRVAASRVRSARRRELDVGSTAAVAVGVALGVGIGSALLLESAGDGGGVDGGGGDGISRVLRLLRP